MRESLVVQGPVVLGLSKRQPHRKRNKRKIVMMASTRSEYLYAAQLNERESGGFNYARVKKLNKKSKLSLLLRERKDRK